MRTRIALAALALSAATLAHAGDFGSHPATQSKRPASIDASTLMYGHPASPLNGTSDERVTVASNSR